jgi:hypothetical protein
MSSLCLTFYGGFKSGAKLQTIIIQSNENSGPKNKMLCFKLRIYIMFLKSWEHIMFLKSLPPFSQTCSLTSIFNDFGIYDETAVVYRGFPPNF